MAPILPWGRLLDIFAPIVDERWVCEYYKKRHVSLLLDNAGPNQDRSQYAHDRKFDDKLREADVVLVLDGGTLKCEKSHGLREQKENYDWSKGSARSPSADFVGVIW